MKIIFILDNIRSSFNVGSIFRTADGLGFDINLIGITPIPGKDNKLEKTSLSSLQYVNWNYFQDENAWYESIANSEKKLIISIEETKDFETIPLFDIDEKVNVKDYENIYIILGHEINGVSKFLMSKSDHIVKIPMFGKKNSLNVGTCAGIIGYKIKELLS